MSNRIQLLQGLQATIGRLDRSVAPAKAGKPVKVKPVAPYQSIEDFAMKARTPIWMSNDKPMRYGESGSIQPHKRLYIRIADLAARGLKGK